MKATNHNNLGRKYLVEDCKNIRIEYVVRKAKKELLNTIIKGMVEIGGYNVKITSHTLHHGGQRLWFVCPSCNQKVGIIYEHPIKNNLIGCRICLNLDYRCRAKKGMIENQYNNQK
ncbi:hypothetical protein C0581_03375 [Candidatus Parcubacteria bacterium]|nr:MAG: hypothetical protein C0581_03375 [Candidatus Parcubacteria bacterium]